MSLKDRKSKREAATQFAKVIGRDKEGRITSVNVPGSEGKTYKVILRRGSFGVQTECLCETGCGALPCKGNRKTICYHAQAAVMLAASKGKTFWCESREDADRLTHLNHGAIVPITTSQGEGKAYLVYAAKK